MIKTRLIKLLSHAKKYIVYQILWQWVALLCQILIIYSISKLIEGAFYSLLNNDLYIKYFGLIFVGIVIRFISDKMAGNSSYQASVDVKRILRGKIYDKLLKLGTSYRSKVSTSEVVQVSVEGVEQLETYFGRYLPQLFYAMLAPLTLFVILLFVNVKASIVLLVCVPLIPISIVAVQKIAKKLLSKYWRTYTELGDGFLENLQGLTTLKIYEADADKATVMDEEAEKFRKVTMKVLMMQLNSTSVMDIVAYGGAAVGMVVSLYQFLHGDISISGAVMIILIASEFFIPMRILGSFFHIAMNGMAASDKIFAFLDLPEDGEKTGIIDSTKAIKIEGLNFNYVKEKNTKEYRLILDDIDMLLPSGSFVSLVGESGSGKSTIAGLLMGRNKDYEGSIKIGNTELSDLKEENLMENITYISHDSYLFKGPVRENLLMGNREATDEMMIEALDKVNLRVFMDSQNGLETELFENGANLSGGQRQRLAIARALLHDTPIYIFDEATSNIDVESEELIMQVIHELTRDKTVLLISHRLANVVDSDYIYMLKDGKTVENGNHTDLMNHKGAYYDLFTKQRELEEYRKEAF